MERILYFVAARERSNGFLRAEQPSNKKRCLGNTQVSEALIFEKGNNGNIKYLKHQYRQLTCW
jgi:hypothetical protein